MQTGGSLCCDANQQVHGESASMPRFDPDLAIAD
jgi:hypothetical protein